MPIGDRIRKRRLELNMSQDELAKAIGYSSRSTVNKIEADGRKLPQDKIKAIAIALRTTPSYILDWEEDTDTRPVTGDPGELTLLAGYRTLNAAGKKLALAQMCDLTEHPKYCVPGTAVSGTRALSA